MIRRPPRSTRTDTLFPYTTLFRSAVMVTTVQVGGSSAWQALRRHFLASPLYGITLAGTAPRELRLVPRDPWPGESARGEALLRDESGMSAASARGTDESDTVLTAWLHG